MESCLTPEAEKRDEREGFLVKFVALAYVVIMATADASMRLAADAPECGATIKNTTIGSENGSQILSLGQSFFLIVRCIAKEEIQFPCQKHRVYR